LKFLSQWRLRKPAEDSETVYVSERYGVRSLHIGSDTVQSAMRLKAPNELELAYTRSMMAFLLFVPDPQHVLMIGLGGGSVAKFIHHKMPAVKVQAVEVSPRVVSIARQCFNVPPNGPRFEIIVTDGAEYARRDDVGTDVLMVDGYDADAHVEELASAAFYESCRARLNSGGMLVVNLWGGDKEFHVLLQRIHKAFPAGTLCLPASRPGNVIAFGFRDAPAPFAWKALFRHASKLETQYGLEFPRFVEGFRTMNECDAERLYP
jgi:spermidine synthase